MFLNQALRYKFTINPKNMKCPKCDETLLMMDKQGVEIDYCPSCRGIWLDRGELEKIIDRSAEHYSKRENYDSDARKYGYGEYSSEYNRKYPHGKKKSFLNDLFDF